jgi:hypothetical protein
MSEEESYEEESIPEEEVKTLPEEQAAPEQSPQAVLPAEQAVPAVEGAKGNFKKFVVISLVVIAVLLGVLAVLSRM